MQPQVPGRRILIPAHLTRPAFPQSRHRASLPPPTAAQASKAPSPLLQQPSSAAEPSGQALPQDVWAADSSTWTAIDPFNMHAYGIQDLLSL